MPRPKRSRTPEWAIVLEDARVRKNWTHMDICGKIGCSQPTYWAWRAGGRKPHRKYFLRLAGIMEVSIERLLYLLSEGDVIGGTDEKQP